MCRFSSGAEIQTVKFIPLQEKIPLEEMEKEPLLKLPAQSVRDHYRWETRKVTRDGLISFDGVRYGVPWQYSGKEVQVRLHHGFVEIYYGEVILAKHKAHHGSTRIVWLDGQYKGLTERKGIASLYPAAHMSVQKVEQRDLSFYDQLLGGVFHG